MTPEEKYMTDPKTASTDENVIGGSKPAGSCDGAAVSDVKRSESDERRFQDALEDDEVRGRCEPFAVVNRDLRHRVTAPTKRFALTAAASRYPLRRAGSRNTGDA
jgi:hypothetical protein